MANYELVRCLKTCTSTLSEANLRGADLYGANLRGVDLRGADLRGADLRGADLRRADFSEADLSWAVLRGVDLSWADLRGANLRRANLRGTSVITMHLAPYEIILSKTHLVVGCQRKSLKFWIWLPESRLLRLDPGNADLGDWIRRNRPILIEAIKSLHGGELPK